MRSILFVSTLAVGLLAVAMLAGCTENKKIFDLERIPQTYRDCAAEVIPELKGTGKVSLKELAEYTARLKASAHRKDACLDSAIAWADAQWSAYQQFRPQGY